MNNLQQEQVSSPSKVSQRLLKGMTPEEQKKFTGSYMRAKTVLKRIHEYASKESTKSGLALDNPANFESPNWQYMIAWHGGYRTAMRIMQDVTRTK